MTRTGWIITAIGIVVINAQIPLFCHGGIERWWEPIPFMLLSGAWGAATPWLFPHPLQQPPSDERDGPGE